MRNGKPKKRWKRIGIISATVMVLFFSTLILMANVYVEPVLRKRLHTLIIEGSDSLYTYQLGSLHTNLFGGNIEVIGLHINIDSARYYELEKKNALPSMVMQVDVERARIRGIGILPLLFSKKIYINEISSHEADVRLLRNFRKEDSSTTVTRNRLPLWKALQPAIKDIAVKRIKLDGIKLLYKNTGAEDAAKLQFDRCDALFENIRIDSVAMADTARIGYVENFSLKLHDLKFRTNDSTYKLKAEWITYNSAQRMLQVDSFKLQPTLDKEERIDSMRKSWYTVTFDKVNFTGLRLDRYLRFNRAEADSVIFQNPKLAVFQDKQGLKSYQSKIGHYPHQQLLNANAMIAMKKFIAHNMQVAITEKHEETREEGTIMLDNLEIMVENIVNDPALVKQNPVSTATAKGKIIGSPIEAAFRFYLDSAEGRFDVKGTVRDIAAGQVNPISTRLANIVVPSVQINTLNFFVRGEDFGATSDVEMQYNNLALIFRKRNEETGANTTRKFLTKILNRYVITPSNPFNGEEKRATDVKVARLTTQSFFGIIWKAVFEGMQRIMLRTGHI
jgi:hypothetical protein